MSILSLAMPFEISFVKIGDYYMHDYITHLFVAIAYI